MARTLGLTLALCVLSAVLLSAQTPSVENCTLEGECVKVLDGDTLQLRNGERVRLLGIDTPETGEPFAYDAKRFTRKLVNFHPVRLELDEAERDSYGRLLAHVYVETDEGWILVNAEIMRAGLAKLLFIPPNSRYYGYFEAAQQEAMIHRRGIWGSIDGVLSIEELECRLVECTTEVIAVRFLIGTVSEDEEHVLLRASEGKFGFTVIVPRGSEAYEELALEPSLDGRWVEVIGILEGDAEIGPCIMAESPDQLTFDTEPATSFDTP